MGLVTCSKSWLGWRGRFGRSVGMEVGGSGGERVMERGLSAGEVGLGCQGCLLVVPACVKRDVSWQSLH